MIPKVSVLIPTYNYARYLPEAIESVLAQDFQNYEILIVDDCSHDNSAEIIQRYANKDPRIRYKINSPNLGMPMNWNLCMEMARGDYLKFVFGDDRLCSSQALSRMVAVLDKHSEVSLVVSARTILDDQSRIVDIWDRISVEGIHKGADITLRCVELGTNNILGEPSAALFRKRDVSRGFNTRYRQLVDLEYWLYLLGSGDLYHLAEPLCGFRRHPLQQTNFNSKEGIVDLERTMIRHDYHDRIREAAKGKTRTLFNIAYNLRQKYRDIPPSETDKCLANAIDHKWYAAYWLHDKLSYPFQRLLGLIRESTIHKYRVRKVAERQHR